MEQKDDPKLNAMTAACASPYPRPMNLIQQGDVLIERIASIPAGAVLQTGRIILAKGEVTGHCHEIEEQEGVQLYTLDEILYLVTTRETTVTHQEHSHVTVPPGAYQIRKVLEWDYTQHEARLVQD